ncbi:MAG: phenylalanine--tRNA ligase beta subunit-related protein, partial [Chloroflexota bacterium]
MGKPTHTFDAAAVHEGTIIVRRARAGERLETLDHVVRDLDPETLVIADPREVIGIAGVMGGAGSEVSDTTADVVIESAIFDPVSIRRTGQRYALRSEASHRFEKGQDIPTARLGADRVAQLVAAWSGGAVHPGRIDTDPVEPDRSRVAFRPARIERLLGFSLPAADQRALLARVGIETEEPAGPVSVPVVDGEGGLAVEAGREDALVALVPTWRRDIAIEADFAEEVARVRGYDAVPSRRPATSMPSFRPSPLGVRDAVRQALVGAGLSEVVSHALVAPHSLAALPWPDDGPLPSGEARSGGTVITVRNPLSTQHSVLRQHLAPSLLDLLVTNERHGRERIALFEVGKGYATSPDGPREWWRLGFVLAGDAGPAAWNREARPYDLDDAKAVVEVIAERLALVLRHANDAILLLDGELRVIEANDRASALYGYSPAELLRLSIRDLRTAESSESLAPALAQARRPAGYVFETVHCRKDGSTLPVEVSSRPVEIGGRPHLLSVIRDVSERKGHEAQMERLNRMYRVMSRVNEAIVHEIDGLDLKRKVCRILVEVGGFRLAWIGWPEASGVLVPQASAGDEAGYLDAIRVAVDDRPEGLGPTGTAFREGRTVVCNDFQADPR